jgi:hypothetical protein
MSKSYCNNSIIKDTLTNSNNVGLLAQNFTSSSVTFAGTAAIASKVTINPITMDGKNEKAGQIFYDSTTKRLYFCVSSGDGSTANSSTFIVMDADVASDAVKQGTFSAIGPSQADSAINGSA